MMFATKIFRHTLDIFSEAKGCVIDRSIINMEQIWNVRSISASKAKMLSGEAKQEVA